MRALATLGLLLWACHAAERSQRLGPVAKGSDDRNDYRAIRLDNGLVAVLVSNPSLSKAAASLAVNVGSYSDPDDTPGLAHFLEHMLFMGTEKYPKESEYNEFLTAHGGTSNAYTAGDHTNYYFDVSVQHLAGALDRFAQFFVKPLFRHDRVAREMNAVNSEHEKNIKDDLWRARQAISTLYDPKHPLRKFGTGTRETLNQPDIESRLHSFYRGHYSAGLMKLAVVGGEPLDDLERMVVELFASVPVNGSVNLHPQYDPNPFGTTAPRRIISVKTFGPSSQLNVVFQLPDLSPYSPSKPEMIISSLLGSKSQGSLLSLLRKRLLAKDLEVGLSVSLRGFSLYQINVDLTDKGFQQYNQVLQAIFAAIALIRKNIPQYFLRDTMQLGRIGFDYASPKTVSKLALQLSVNLLEFPAEKVLTGPALIEKVDPSAISLVLSKLVMDNCYAVLLSPQVDLGTHPLIERWYGTEYAVRELDNSLKESQEDAELLGLALPPPNQYIPKDFTIFGRKAEKPAVAPARIDMGAGLTLWHKLDDTFLLPKAQLEFTVFSSAMDGQSRTFYPALLLLHILIKQSSELDDEAVSAGLSWSASAFSRGVTFSFDGFHEHLPGFMGQVVKRFANFSCSPDEYSLHKRTVRDSVEQTRLNQAYQRASHFLGRAILEPSAGDEHEILKVLDSLTLDDLLRFRDHFVHSSSLQVDGLVMGNVPEDRARTIFSDFCSLLTPSSAPSTQLGQFGPVSIESRAVQLKPGTDMTLVGPDPIVNANYGIIYYLQTGSLRDMQVRTRLGMFEAVFRDLVFSVLRSQMQLGYIVALTRSNFGLAGGLSVIVQSPGKTPPELEGHIEDLLRRLPDHLASLSAEDFAKYRSARQDTLRAAPQNLASETQRLSAAILDQQHDFTAALEQANHLESYEKDDLLRFTNDYIVPGALERRKLSVHVWPERSAPTREFVRAQYGGKDRIYFDPGQVKQGQPLFAPA